MKKSLCLLIGIMIFSMLFLLACKDTTYENLKVEVNDVSKKMNDEFDLAKSIVGDFQKYILTTITAPDIEKVDISKMDEKNGGQFYTFSKDGKNMYVRKYNPNKLDTLTAAIFGATPITDLKKKKLFSLIQKEQTVLDLFKKSKYTINIAFSSIPEEDIFISVPCIDIAALFPPGLSLTVFDWFLPAIQNGKDKINAYPPNISVGANGVICSFNTGAYIGDKGIGMPALDIALLKLANDLTKDTKNMIFIAYKDTNVFGASKTIKDNLKIKVMTDFDYVEQSKANPKFSDEFRLNNEKQSADLKKLGDLLKPENVGNEKLTISINNKDYKVYLNELKETEYFIVGVK